ncbi:MAG: hypothetical protein B5M55_03445 [Desulfococcus sp. 4484_242]|nr:MAG: hypothetical protein B5M55_03445 [Desulfococcus sp. 4484_242]
MNILSFNWHTPYLSLLARLDHHFDVAPANRQGHIHKEPWHENMRPLTPNVTPITTAEALKRLKNSHYDLVLGHNVADMAFTRAFSLPKILVFHTRFLTEPRNRDRPEMIEACRRQIRELISGVYCVFIAETKRYDWGLPGEVIMPGVDVSLYGGYTGENPRVLRVGNFIRMRDETSGYSMQEAVLQGLPSLVMGDNPDIPGARPSRDWEDLKQAYRENRLFLNTTIPEWEDGYNLAMLEAMATGMPVVSLSNPVSPLTDGLNGYVSADISGLRQRVHMLLRDLNLAKTIGSEGKRTVERFFPIGPFLEKWERAIRRAYAWYPHPAGTVFSVERGEESALEQRGRRAYQDGDLAEAEVCFRRLVSLCSKAEHKGMLGVVLLEAGRYAEAESVLAEAAAGTPSNSVWLMNHGNALRALGREDEAARRFREALSADPNLAEAAVNLGDLLHGQGLWREADEAWARAEALRPGKAVIQWKRLFAPLPAAPASEEEIEACRMEFKQRLETFARHIPSDFSLETVGHAQPFLLAYQGRDDNALMRLYGGLVEEAARRTLPQYLQPIPRLLERGERMRVGFASAFFCSHSVWKIPLAGWIQGLDRARFEVFCYHLGVRSDEITDQAAAGVDHFKRGPKPLSKWADMIAGDRLHALIYPEIGMDGLTIQLAALRLAPVQAVGLGHPQTTGLSTVDAFLSSELMKPDRPEESYGERIVPLPGIGVAYRPRPTCPRVASRRGLGADEETVLFWCCHYISKYEPRHDILYPLIARELPRARFLFLGPVRGKAGFEILHRRLHAAFAGHGLDFDRYVQILPRMSTEQFDAVSRACDFFLDNPGWSGFNSALECLAVGLPVLTCRGGTVRSNHAAAVLERIGLADLVACNMEDLARMAVRLGKDPGARADLSARIARGLPRLYEDQEPVRALEEWLLSVSRESDGSGI